MFGLLQAAERAVVVRGHARTLPADKKEPALKDALTLSCNQGPNSCMC